MSESMFPYDQDGSPKDIGALEWCRTYAEILWKRAREELIEAADVGVTLKSGRAYDLRRGLSELSLATSYLQRFESGDRDPGVSIDRVEEIFASADTILGQVRNRRRHPDVS